MNPSTVAPSRSRKIDKARMLVVDDEPDNLDLLYRTFRRNFEVLRAESGQQALEILSQKGEVAVIISDQRMPEMKGTEFLSKTVPDFPDTVRIILTGFTDVEDLVDAINAGQVYRYITKPWDPDELKHVVDQAARTYNLLKQRGEAIALSQNQHRLVVKLVDVAQAATEAEPALPEMAAAIHAVLGAKGCVVQQVSNGELTGHGGAAGEASPELLKEDPLVAAAIADQSLQICYDAPRDVSPEARGAYETAGVGCHYVAPVSFRNQVIAVVSVQWQRPQVPSTAVQELVELAAKQVSLVLVCL